MAADPGVLGLIAGAGSFPLDVAAAARERGYHIVAVAFHELTDPALDTRATVTWLRPGEVAAGVAALTRAGVTQAVMAGKVPKTLLHGPSERLGLDAEAQAVLAEQGARGDQALLCAVADHLERRGIRLLPQREFAARLLVPAGVLGRVEPTRAQQRDVELGWRLARGVAALDIGQTLVVKHGSVLAVEAIDGTDAAIERAGRIAAGACVVKVAGPGKDPRFDLPTIGPDTLRVLVRARAAVLAVEADCSVLLERDAVVRAADAHGIALVGLAGNPIAEGGEAA